MRPGPETHHLIMDYVAMCERRGEVLDLAGFINLWKVATEIAEDACADGPPDPDLIDRILGGG